MATKSQTTTLPPTIPIETSPDPVNNKFPSSYSQVKPSESIDSSPKCTLNFNETMISGSTSRCTGSSQRNLTLNQATCPDFQIADNVWCWFWQDVQIRIETWQCSPGQEKIKRITACCS
jgi:hypothetical protein